MKNTCIITQRLYGGGAERAAANLSRDLAEKYNVYLIVYDGVKTEFPYGGTLIDCGTKPAKTFFGKTINFIKRLHRIKKVKKTYKIDYSISFLKTANLLNVLSHKKDKIIISIRNMMSLSPNSNLDNRIIKWCGKKADMTVSLSKGVEKDLIDHYGYRKEKVTTIYNSCDYSSFFGQAADNYQIDEMIGSASHILVNTGRLVKQKGQWHLIRAMSIVKRTYPNCKLIIFGEGALHNSLLSYAEKMNVSENILLPGYINNYHSIMKKCDMFVFASLFEGLGNVLLEALACGMPVVSCDCKYGPKEILSEEDSVVNNVCFMDYGVMYPPFSQKDFDESDLEFEKSDYYLAEAILRLLNSKELSDRYREKSLMRIKNFSPENIKKQWDYLFEKLEEHY